MFSRFLPDRNSAKALDHNAERCFPRPKALNFVFLRQQFRRPFEMRKPSILCSFRISNGRRNCCRRNTKLRVMGSPKISVTKLAPDNPFTYSAEVAIMPDVTVGDYQAFKTKKGIP